MFDLTMVELFKVYIFIGAMVFVIIPVVSTLIDLFVSFVIRKEFYTPSLLSYLFYDNKDNREAAWRTPKEVADNVCGAKYFLALFVYLIAAMLLALLGKAAYDNGATWHTEPYGAWYCLFLLIPHAIRFVVDVCKSLKLNHKTGDAERLSELEKEMEALKAKVKK